ncbi:rCG29797 [Rattus norvegicus]|uniref:RCG29797 n=1 Tax=Rattus norvegicus TaxID=10116 RepID=A6IL33_RAT|nr:rCG29797 [Rattus norvegicus]
MATFPRKRFHSAGGCTEDHQRPVHELCKGELMRRKTVWPGVPGS